MYECLVKVKAENSKAALHYAIGNGVSLQQAVPLHPSAYPFWFMLGTKRPCKYSGATGAA